jgi:hypothetical protein
MLGNVIYTGKTLILTYMTSTITLPGPYGTETVITTSITVVGPNPVTHVSVSTDGSISFNVGNHSGSFSGGFNITSSSLGLSASYSNTATYGSGKNADTVSTDVTVTFQTDSNGVDTDTIENGLQLSVEGVGAVAVGAAGVEYVGAGLAWFWRNIVVPCGEGACGE